MIKRFIVAVHNRTLARIKHSRSFLLKMLPKNSIGAEIGVFEGDFSLRLLKVVKPKELHLIDPWKFEQGEEYKKAFFGGVAGSQGYMDKKFNFVKKRFKKYIKEGIVKLHRGYSNETVKGFKDNYFDWVYIDGNHLYEFVKQDLELCSEKLKKGGILSGDDYREGRWWKGGVKKAVDEFIAQGKAELIIIREGQFVLRKK